MRPSLLALFAAYLSALSAAAVAQEVVPTDIELRSAYCVSVVKAEIAFLQREIGRVDAAAKNSPTPEMQQYAAKMSAEGHEAMPKLAAALNRLQLYLLPSMTTRDPVALMAAMKRGEADFQEVGAMTERCSAKCNALPHDKWPSCYASCTDNDLLERVRACKTPTWLPF
jgi:hypothetical protein